MSGWYSKFSTATGELTGLIIEGSDDDLNGNAPPGFAWVAGRLDPRLWTVTIPVGDDGPLQPVAVARPPDRPADTDYQTWSWDDDLGDWVATYTLKWHQRVAMEPLLNQLTVLDAPLARPLSEVLLALVAGTEVPAVALDKLTAVEGEKTPLRTRLAAIEATESLDDLQDLLDTPP